MHIGIAADHGGFALKVQLTTDFKAVGYEWLTSALMSWSQEMTTQIL